MINKKSLFVAITVIVSLLLFPFILNWLILKEQIVPVVGDGTTWLTFWPVYLSAIASFGMIYITYLSLKQSRAQLEDLKKREDEERRTRLVFSVIVYQSAFYLRIFNIGKENAFNVKLNFNEGFINAIKDSYRQYYIKLSKPDFIEAGKSIYILIGWCDEVNKEWDGKDIILLIMGSYNDKYAVNETLDMGYFIGKTHFLVKGDLETTMEYMKKGLIVQNDSYMPVQKSLDEIAHTMLRIDYSLMELSKQAGNPNNTQGGVEVPSVKDEEVSHENDVPESMAVLRD